MPISGFIMSAMGGHGVDFFGMELAACNHDPTDPKEIIALNAPFAGIAHSMHEIAGKAIFVGVILHVVGALKHHMIDKDGTLRRMLGATV